VRVREALVGRGCVNSTTTTHATSRDQISCWCGSSSSTCDSRTWMTCMVAAQPCGGNEAINQTIKKQQHQRDASLFLSVDSFSVARWLLWNGGCTILTCSLRYD